MKREEVKSKIDKPLSRFVDSGGVSSLKSELYGRAANLRLAENFRTDWVSSLSTGGDEENRTPVRKSIHTGVSERRRFFEFPCKDVKRQTSLRGSSYCVTAAGTSHRSRSPLK